MDPIHIPPAPRHLRTFLMEETGVEPVLSLRGKVLVLEHKNERVRLTVTYRFGVFHRVPTWSQTGSTLEIDGKPSQLAEDEAEYVKVFRGEAEPTGPAWESGQVPSRATPRHGGHNMLRAVKAGPARSRRR